MAEHGHAGGIQSVALVTGASSGIGAQIARELASRSCALALAARRVDRLETLARELREKWGVRAHVFAADLASPDGARRLVEDVGRAGLAIDVLVNNAGFGWRGRFVESDVGRMLEMVRVNVAAVTELTRLVLPGMIERAALDATDERRRGAVGEERSAARGGGGPELALGAPSRVAFRGRGILNVASTAAFVPGPFMAVYYASKAYVESFSVAIREELRGTGVHCTCLCPGPVATEFSGVAGTENTRLFKRLTRTDAPRLARAGVDGLVHNRAVVIAGPGNRVVTLGSRMLSRAHAARIARGLQEDSDRVG